MIIESGESIRVGISVPHYGDFATPEAIIEVSRAAESMGYDSLWTGDRILAPLNPSNGYGGGDGPMPEQFKTYLDPLFALTFAAAHTERMRLGMSTLNALWYPPVLLARALTTLDVLSNGRVDAGFGISWLKDEYTAVNVPWEGRGARLDETLDVLDKIWTSEIVEHDGPHFSIVPTTIRPKPVQRPRIPILLSAFTPAALRRVGRRADGWLAVGMPLEYLTGMRETIREEAKAAGRAPEAVRTVMRINADFTDAPAPAENVPVTGTLKQVVAYVRDAADVGVDEVFIDLGQMTTTTSEMVEIAGEFITALRAG